MEMTREELEREAVRKSLSYNTKYSEDGDLNDMLSRPQDFIEGSIAGMVDLLRKKAYRDGMVDGAEPREKRIADLEKENAELKEKSSRQSKNYKCDVGKLLEENAEWKKRNETLKDALEHARKVYGDDLEKSYKEIAELKEAIKHFNPCSEWNDDVHDCEFRHYAMEYGSKLTKATDLLKKVIKVTWGEGWNYSLDVKVEAEQFIKDLEK